MWDKIEEDGQAKNDDDNDECCNGGWDGCLAWAVMAFACPPRPPSVIPLAGKPVILIGWGLHSNVNNPSSDVLLSETGHAEQLQASAQFSFIICMRRWLMKSDDS